LISISAEERVLQSASQLKSLLNMHHAGYRDMITRLIQRIRIDCVYVFTCIWTARA